MLGTILSGRWVLIMAVVSTVSIVVAIGAGTERNLLPGHLSPPPAPTTKAPPPPPSFEEEPPPPPAKVKKRAPAKRARRARARPLAIALAGVATPRYIHLDLARLRNTEIGRMARRCVESRPNKIDEARENIGIDVFEDIEEIGATEDLVVMGGDFAGANFKNLRYTKDGVVTPYGDESLLVSSESGHGEQFGVWRERVIIIGRDQGAIMEALERLEGRAPAAPNPPDSAPISGYAPVSDLIEALPLSYDTRAPMRDALDASQALMRFSINVDREIDAHVEVTQDGGALAIGAVLHGALGAMRLGLGGKEGGSEPWMGPLLDGLRLDVGEDALAIEGRLDAAGFATLLGSCLDEAIQEPVPQD